MMSTLYKKRDKQDRETKQIFRCAHTHDVMATTRIVMRKRRDVPAGFKPPRPVANAPAAGTTSAAGANPPSAGTKVAATNAPGKGAPVVGSQAGGVNKQTLEEKEVAERPPQFPDAPVPPLQNDYFQEEPGDDKPSREVQELFAQFETFAATTPHKGEELVTLMADLLAKPFLPKLKRPTKIESIGSDKVEKRCYAWVSQQQHHDPNRVLTWCVLTGNDPDVCGPSVCFDVDEVQEWIKAQTKYHGAGQTTDAKGAVVACDPLPCQCPMFMRKQLQAKINELSKTTDEYIVPEYMPDEFREAFEDFDMWSQLDITKITRDRVLDTIRKFMENWISARVQATSEDEPHAAKGLGTFWYYTKRAFASLKKGAWSATWFLLKNPLLLMGIATIARFARMAMCMTASYHTLGPELTLLLLEQLVNDATRTSRIIKAMLVGVVNCLKAGSGMWYNPSCWISAIRGFGALAELIVLFLTNVGGRLFEALGFPTIAEWIYGISNKPGGLIYYALFGDWSFFGGTGNVQQIYNVMHKHNTQNWDLVAVLTFLSSMPTGVLGKYFFPFMLQTLPLLISAGMSISAFGAGMVPIVGAASAGVLAGGAAAVTVTGVVLYKVYKLVMKKYGMKPILWLKFLAQSSLTSMAFVQFITEVKDWMLDLIPCMWDYFRRTLQYYFGFVIGYDDPHSATSCCMTQMVSDLQALNFTKKDEAKLRVDLAKRTDSTKQAVYTYMTSPTPENLKAAQLEIDSLEGIELEEFLHAKQHHNLILVDPNGIVADKDTRIAHTATVGRGARTRRPEPQRFGERPAPLVSVPNLTTAEVARPNAPLRQVADEFGQPLVLPREMAIDIIPLSKQNTSSFAQIIGRGTSHIGSWFSGILATPSDMRLKNLVFDEPVFEIKAKDGNVIPFYVFVWKPEAGFADNYRMHISVMAQQIERLYPNAVFVYHGVKLVLLKRLPPEVAKHIIMSNNVLVDLRKLA